MRINGVLIDCARLLEPHEYYRRLLDFMSQWRMNTLLLHLSDDHGLALKLPGFGDLALPHAFNPNDLKKLMAFARTRGIDIIPELQTFGHTRYITDTPRYRHLFAGRWTRALCFNAIDPLHPDTLRLMRRLIRSVARAFPSAYIHLGGDEVDIAEYCRRRGLSAPEVVWTDHINRMIDIAREAGKIPMIWADHVMKSNAVADRLRKDVVLVAWWYWENPDDDILPRLKRFGFKDFVVAPSVACYMYRFFPPRQALRNTDQMLAIGRKHDAQGMINTIWCPWRYLQNAMYYGIAYSALAVRKGTPPEMRAFNRELARRVFKTGVPSALGAFLAIWPDLSLDSTLIPRLSEPHPVLAPKEIRHLRLIVRLGARALRAAGDYQPRANPDIWHAMVLAAQCIWVCAESLLLRQTPSVTSGRKARYNQRLSEVRREMDAEWDRTRYPNDPQKRKPRFPGDGNEYAMILLKKLPYVH